MHCRKVRSYLPTFSNGELSGSVQMAVREHLSNCPACRAESATYVAMKQSLKSKARITTSSDFNTKLLNRIAQERYSEVRTKAYLPKRAPLFTWRTVAPVLVTSVALAVTGVTLIKDNYYFHSTESVAQAVNPAQDDSYLTVQPTFNPNLSSSLGPSWSLNRSVAQSERLTTLGRGLTSRGYGYGHLASVNQRPMDAAVFFNDPRMKIYHFSGHILTPQGAASKR